MQINLDESSTKLTHFNNKEKILCDKTTGGTKIILSAI
jgi:hypothetical protein